MHQDIENNESEAELAEDDSLFAFSPYYDNINEVLNEQYALLQLGEWEYEEFDISESSESSEGNEESVNTERVTEVQNQSKFVIEGLSAILNDHTEKHLSHEYLCSKKETEHLSELSTLDDSNDFCEHEEEEIQEKGRESELHCAKFSTLEPRYFEMMPPSPAIVSVPAPAVLLHPLLEEECQLANKNTDITNICNSNTAEDFCGASTVGNNAQHFKEFNELHLCEGKVEKSCKGHVTRSHKLQHSNVKQKNNVVELAGCDCIDSKGINNIDRSNSVNSCDKNENSFEKSKNKLLSKKLGVKEKEKSSRSKASSNKKSNNYFITSVDEDLQKRISKYTNDKLFVHVYDPEFRYMFEVPVAAIRHLPPARLNITRLVLCRNYRAPNMLHVSNDTTGSNNNIHYNGLTMLNEGHNNTNNNVNNALSATNSLQFGCQMGSSCKFVHADCDYSKLVRHSVHVNYIWRSPELCIYPRLPSGSSVKVCDIEHGDNVHELPSELLLQTNGSLSWTEALCPLHSCVDYDVSGMCTNGELCRFAHRLLIDLNLNTNFKRAPKKTKLVKVERKSSSTTHDNIFCNSHTFAKEESSILLEKASERKENRAILEDISVNTVPVESSTSSNVMPKCRKMFKDITSSSNHQSIKEKEYVNTSYVFTIMETDKAKDVLHDMSSIGTLLLLPKNSTQALVLGSIQRDDLHHITGVYNKEKHTCKDYAYETNAWARELFLQRLPFSPEKSQL